MNDSNLSWQEEFFATSSASILYHCLLVISIVTILGNLVVVMSIAFGLRRMKPILIVLASLAVTDTFGGCTGVYKYLYIYAEIVPANIYTCWITYSLQVVCYISSCLHITALSLDCYLGTEKPLKHKRKLRKRHVKMIITGCWVTPVLYSLVSIPIKITSFNNQNDSGYIQYWYNHYKCTLDNEGGHNLIDIITVAVIFIIPVLNVALYARLYWIIHHRTITTPRQTKNMKCLITVCLLCIVFLAFYTPVLILGFIRETQQLRHNDVTLYLHPLHIVTILPVLNSMCNPLLYGFRIRGVRLGLYNIVQASRSSKVIASSTNGQELPELRSQCSL